MISRVTASSRRLKRGPICARSQAACAPAALRASAAACARRAAPIGRGRARDGAPAHSGSCPAYGAGATAHRQRLSAADCASRVHGGGCSAGLHAPEAFLSFESINLTQARSAGPQAALGRWPPACRPGWRPRARRARLRATAAAQTRPPPPGTGPAPPAAGSPAPPRARVGVS